MVIKIYNENENGTDVVLKDENDAVSWNFSDKSAAEAFAADLEAVLGKHDVG